MTRAAIRGQGFSSPRLRHAALRAQAAIPSPPFMQSRLPDGRPWMSCYRCEDSYLVRFQDLADFEIAAEGTEITVHAVPETPAGTLEHLYQNQALPFALSLQHVPVFHGSAIEVDGEAVAFIGASRRGKSTLAASFSRHGHRFLGDDGLFLGRSEDRYVVYPGAAAIRLWEDSLQALARDLKDTVQAADRKPKSFLPAGTDLPHCPEPRLLRRVYFLDDGTAESVTIQKVSGQRAMVQMLRHCFLLGVDQRDMLEHNFSQLSALCQLPVFFSLDYPRSYELLGDVRAAVTAHCRLGSAPGRGR